MRIGVIGVQGDVSEHVDAVARAMKEYGKEGEAIAVRRREDLARVDGLTIPGGESTTISKLLVKLGLFDEIVRRATLRAWGDCTELSRYKDRIVLAQQGHLIASAFHPELSGDLRIHRWFLDLV